MESLHTSKHFTKFNLQVIGILLCVALTTSITVFFVIYTNSFQILLNALKVRANIVSDYTQEFITVHTIASINDRSDENSPLYSKLQKRLNNIQRVSNLRYLYVMKQIDDQYIYVIDSLEQDNPNFHHTGTPVDPNYIPDLQRCLQGETVVIDQYLDDKQERAMITYLPIKDTSGQAQGAIVLYFNIQPSHNAHRQILVYGALLSALVAALSAGIGIFVLKKISDPFYNTLAYTDFLTGLGNRAAFEQELVKLEHKTLKENNISLMIFDLNNLKYVNDRFGHAAGDQYIKQAAQTIAKIVAELGQCYRIGGDEFAAIIVDYPQAAITELLEQTLLHDSWQRPPLLEPWAPHFSLAYGLATYCKEQDVKLHDTFNRADNAMYECKYYMKSHPKNSRLNDPPKRL